MAKPPLILISPHIEKKGDEFGDVSISLSETYQKALLGAGALPLAMAATISKPMIAEFVARSDGILLTGGEDVEPRIYTKGLSIKDYGVEGNVKVSDHKPIWAKVTV